MNQQQYFLNKLAEEACEIAQIALKTAQFGMDEVYTAEGGVLSNKERIHAELNDLLGVIEILNVGYGFNFEPSPPAILAKRAKVIKYMNYAISLGNVDKDPE